MKTCLKLIHVVRTRSDLSAARFPSPRPSPSGRGGIVSRHLEKIKRWIGQMLFRKPGNFLR